MWQILRPDAVRVLHDEKCRASLARYFDILENRKHAKFQLAKRLPAKFSEDDSTDELWLMHDDLTEQYYKLEKDVDAKKVGIGEVPQPPSSYLDLKVELARRILQECHFCTRGCKVNRLEGELGFCKCGEEMAMSTYFSHMGEEAELVPSGTVFTCGCTLQCLHCQNWTISQWMEPGETYTAKEMAAVVEMLHEEGCRNANLVGGDPTPWLQAWLDVFTRVKANIPVVWNSNSYYSEQASKLLAGFVDVYLLDFKYGEDRCAVRISSAPGYVEVAKRNHLHALKYGELMVRILLLPEHLECCTKPILKWIAESLGTWVRVNIMDQYRPEWRAHEIPELRRRLHQGEYKSAVEYAGSLGLNNLA